jgi:hypothetical protein
MAISWDGSMDASFAVELKTSKKPLGEDFRAHELDKINKES